MNIKGLVTIIMLLHLRSYAEPNLTQKYFDYRNRLVEDFTLGVGSGFGQSIPASHRYTWARNYQGKNTLKWGDATIELSYYIAVLATEYRLLLQNGKNTDETLRELFYALDAFNRLDYYAEEYFGAKPALNGFYVPNDVGRGLYSDQQRNGNFTDAIHMLNKNSVGDTINNLESEWLNYYLRNDRKRFAMSKDQCFHFFIAAAIIKKCLSENISYSNQKFMDGETLIVREAENISARIIDYLHSPNASNTIGNWRVRLPDGKKVGAGNNAWTFSYGLSMIENKIAGKENPVHKGFSWWWAKTVYNLTWVFFRPVYFFNQGEATKTLSLVLVNNSCNGNANKVYRYAYAFKKYPNIHIPVLYHFLQNKKAEQLNYNDIKKLLDQAPSSGPENTKGMKNRNYNWSSTSLLLHPKRRGSEKPSFPGKYNGLDYMLLYNLYLLNNGKQY